MPGTTTGAFDESARRISPVATPHDQRARVTALLELLRRERAGQSEPATYTLVSPAGEGTELPESVLALLVHTLELLASGDAIAVVPVGKELTTQEAADILNVSRQYLVRLLEEGRIPFSRTGTHRRVRMDAILEFKRRREDERMASLDDLSQLTQDVGGYDELPTDR